MKLTLVAAAFLAIILFVFLPRTIQEYQLSKSNDTVAVTIRQLPDCSSGYKNKYIHISYNDKIYILNAKCKYVQDLSEGQRIYMLHKADTEIFLFRDENVTPELISTILLSVVSTVCLTFSFKPTNTKRRSRTTSASKHKG